MAVKKRTGSNQKVANSLVALSSAAVLTVYTAGYLRTRPAAQRFAVSAAQRRTESPSARASTSDASEIPARVGDAPSRPASSPRLVSTLPAIPDTAAPPASIEPSASIPSAEPATVQPETPAVPAEAPRPIESPATTIAATPDPIKQDHYKDGTYLGWGSCRHGDIQAAVVIAEGRIASATIARCLTRYSCSWIEALPDQVVSRQNTNVDYVSGATQSTDAFADAVADALSKAEAAAAK